MSKEYSKIPQDQYDKALFHFRSQMAAVWNFANCHGLNDKVTEALEASAKLTIQFSQVVRGKDIPIKVTDKPTRRATE